MTTSYDGPGRVVDSAEVDDIPKNYLCTDCWGHLVVFFRRAPDGNLFLVVRCTTDDCPCSGFVSRHWVEKQEAKSMEEARTIKRNLQVAGVLPAPEKKDPSQILAELGF